MTNQHNLIKIMHAVKTCNDFTLHQHLFVSSQKKSNKSCAEESEFLGGF